MAGSKEVDLNESKVRLSFLNHKGFVNQFSFLFFQLYMYVPPLPAHLCIISSVLSDGGYVN